MLLLNGVHALYFLLRHRVAVDLYPVIGVLLLNRVDVLYSCPARGQSCSYNFHRYRTLYSRANLKILIATPLGLHYKKMAEGG